MYKAPKMRDLELPKLKPVGNREPRGDKPVTSPGFS